MKISLKKRLEDYITSYKPREELRAFGNSLNRDSSTSDRKLRELTNEGVIKPIFKGKYIIGYEPNNTKLSPKQPSSEVLPNYMVKARSEELKRAESNQGTLII